ncbi:VPS35 endosomal protein sorting factor like [Phyllostomus discolor]|uniref:VPS35 endosomal protein sorting factor like n=1 Tax=Phyllostomus discolor TaxID=89673 RepID=A0A834BCB4_9CHIR|nr:VPS35 endosomal protein sorting factor like [Phyllostomus discolor]
MAAFPWHSRNRNYKAESATYHLEAVPLEFGDYHPLKPITVTESKMKKVSRKGSTSSTSSSSSSSVVDPLSSVLDGTDPLSMFAATADPTAIAAVMVTHPAGSCPAGAWSCGCRDGSFHLFVFK